MNFNEWLTQYRKDNHSVSRMESDPLFDAWNAAVTQCALACVDRHANGNYKYTHREECLVGVLQVMGVKYD